MPGAHLPAGSGKRIAARPDAWVHRPGLVAAPLLACLRSPLAHTCPEQRATLVVLLVLILDVRFGLQPKAGELVEADRHPPHLDDIPAPIDGRPHPAGAVPLDPVRPPPHQPLLGDIPVGQLFDPGSRRRHPENLGLGGRAEGRIEHEHPVLHGGGRGRRVSRRPEPVTAPLSV
jgi:hypothetical protein